MYKYSNIDLKYKQNTTKNNNNKLIQIQISPRMLSLVADEAEFQP